MKKTRKKTESQARVALVRCGNYDSGKIVESVKKAVDELGGIDRFVRKGQRVLLKPNLLIARPADKHVTTHPEVVRAVIKLVKKAGGKPFIGDSPAIGTAARVAAKCGIADVAAQERVEIVNFNQPADIDNPSGTQFKKFKIDQSVIDSDVVINLPKLKTHGQMTLTLGVKNMFGVIPGTRKTQWHLAAGIDRMQFARMLVDLYQRVSPQLTLMDAVVGMHGNGPQNGEPKRMGLIMASEDAVTLDDAACEIVGLKKDRMFTTIAAEELGIGHSRLQGISIAGERLEDCKVAGFTFPETSDLIGFFPGFLKNYMRDWLTTRPVLNQKKCEQCMVCATHCPAQAISKHNDTLKFDLTRCIRCFCCQEMCPHGAITVGTGPIARLLKL
ncbi:MAG: DUF362 domain-containing protein [Candidatus Abyssobacteria bacterium SURF_17]|uniref:DUF362 domain-containing protein n=1 Tax=Candidatus Abyssobacteria bacterium SURF_17 TaxID=2093361 RepID=A0A419F1D9_9BACT|nr:MAG: DUF362 domain-containing protein [Candidatus Abyssubacteria bacterium SURF_17]